MSSNLNEVDMQFQTREFDSSLFRNIKNIKIQKCCDSFQIRKNDISEIPEFTETSK